MEYVIKVNGKAYTQATSHEVVYSQLWTEGSGRNYGDFAWAGTVAGNFDNVNVSIIPKNKTELSTLIKDLRRSMFNIEYYDHELMGYKTARVYRANFTVKTLYVDSLEVRTEAIELQFVPERRE